MAQIGSTGAVRYCCRSCGAPLEVRVSFKGRLVWAVDPESAAFGDVEPELRGDSQEPQVVCSADVLHKTGFQVQDGVISADPSFDG